MRQPIGHVLNENMLDVINQQRQDINNLATKHQRTKKCDKPPLDFEIWYFPINLLVENVSLLVSSW